MVTNCGAAETPVSADPSVEVSVSAEECVSAETSVSSETSVRASVHLYAAARAKHDGRGRVCRIRWIPAAGLGWPIFADTPLFCKERSFR